MHKPFLTKLITNYSWTLKIQCKTRFRLLRLSASIQLAQSILKDTDKPALCRQFFYGKYCSLNDKMDLRHFSPISRFPDFPFFFLIFTFSFDFKFFDEKYFNYNMYVVDGWNLGFRFVFSESNMIWDMPVWSMYCKKIKVLKSERCIPANDFFLVAKAIWLCKIIN